LQNAGCGHLHHAHCFHMGKDAATTSCPSGCARNLFPREAAIFDPPTPHIVVTWDGDKIDKILIPTPQGGFPQGMPLQLTSDEVVSLIQIFLTAKGFVLPGLSLRIHSRDAVAEYVTTHLRFGVVEALIHFCIVSELCSSLNRLSSPSVTLRCMSIRRIIASQSSQAKSHHRLRFLCRPGVVFTSICIRPMLRLSLADVFAFKNSFASRLALKLLQPLWFCMLSNARPKLGWQIRSEVLPPGNGPTCSGKHGSPVFLRLLGAWRHFCPLYTA
jgi:hypothetical protein